MIDSNDDIFCAGTTNSYFVENNGDYPSNDTTDIMVVKINSSGLFQWKKQFGKESEIFAEITTAAGSEEAHGIELTSDGNIVVAGFSSGSFFNAGAGNDDALLLKMDSSTGDLIWALNSVAI